jgi:hypothetical protein
MVSAMQQLQSTPMQDEYVDPCHHYSGSRAGPAISASGKCTLPGTATVCVSCNVADPCHHQCCCNLQAQPFQPAASAPCQAQPPQCWHSPCVPCALLHCHTGPAWFCSWSAVICCDLYRPVLLQCCCNLQAQLSQPAASTPGHARPQGLCLVQCF